MSSPPLRDPIWRFAAVAVIVGSIVLVGGLALGVFTAGVSSPLEESETTTAHEDPTAVGSDFELGALERRIVDDLREQAEQGALDLGPETYEHAQEQLGDEQYQQLLDQYEDVNGPDGDQQLFIQAQRAQHNFTRHATAYWRLYEAYELVTGDDQLVHPDVSLPESTLFEADDPPEAIARALEREAIRANESAHEAIDLYERAGEADDENYDSLVTSLDRSTSAILETQHEVRQEQFTQTRLSLSDEQATISPTDPLELTGQLTERDGPPVANGTVTLELGAQRIETTTNETGWFDLTYRPTQLRANVTSLDVHYRPENGTAYLGDSQSLDVTVERAEPTIAASVTPSETAFGERVTVDGHISADEAGLSAVPYVVVVDGQVLAHSETNSTGHIETQLSIPADIAAGAQSVTVRVPEDGRAVTGGTAETPLTVTEQETRLSLEATDGENDLLRVSGTLETDTGTAVDNQTVDLFVDGVAVGTATTNDVGLFGQQVVVPESVASDADGGDVTVNATFDGTGTNLHSTSREATAITHGTTGVSTVPPWIPVPVALAVVLGAGYWFYRRRSRDEAGEATQREATSDLPESPGDEHTVSLEQAGALLEAGQTAAAIQAGYATLRHRLQPAERGQTHWEFYHEHRSTMDERSRQALRTVTEHYELAAFSPEETDSAVAADTLEAIRTIEATPQSSDD